MLSHAAKVWWKVFASLFEIISTYCATFIEKYENLSMNTFLVLISVQICNDLLFFFRRLRDCNVNKHGLQLPCPPLRGPPRVVRVASIQQVVWFIQPRPLSSAPDVQGKLSYKEVMTGSVSPYVISSFIHPM